MYFSKDDRGISQICALLWGQVTLHASAMGVQQHHHRVVMWINSKHQTQLSTTSHVLFVMKRWLHTFAQQQIVMWARRLCVIKTSVVSSFEIFMIFCALSTMSFEYLLDLIIIVTLFFTFSDQNTSADILWTCTIIQNSRLICWPFVIIMFQLDAGVHRKHACENIKSTYFSGRDAITSKNS